MTFVDTDPVDVECKLQKAPAECEKLRAENKKI